MRASAGEGVVAHKNHAPLRIVHVITRLIRAGADENTILTCLKQAEAGHEVTLVHGREFDEHFYRTIAGKIRLQKIGSLVRDASPLNDLAALISLVGYFRRERPTVVHTHTSKAGIIGRCAARLAGVPAIIHGVHIVPFNNVGPRRRAAYLLMERAAARVTHAFINVSHGMRDLCVEAGVGQARTHHVVHSGFDLSRFRAARWPQDWRGILGVPTHEQRKPPTAVMLGVLAPRKRQLEFLDAFAGVVGRLPEMRLLFCGEGEARPLIEKRIDELDLRGNVKLLGFRPDPQRIIALADLCFLSSEREGLPRVVMQYLAGGKPCAVAALPGIEEVVRHEVNGLVLPSDRLDLLADAVVRLLSNPGHLKRLAEGAAATPLDSWDAEKMWPRMERVYQDVFRKVGLAQ